MKEMELLKHDIKLIAWVIFMIKSGLSDFVWEVMKSTWEIWIITGVSITIMYLFTAMALSKARRHMKE